MKNMKDEILVALVTGLITLVVLAISITGAVLVSILTGYVVVAYWNWFVLTAFPAAPELTVPVAIGIRLLLSGITHDAEVAHLSDIEKAHKKDGFKSAWYRNTATNIVIHWVALYLIGYLVYQFV